MYILGACPKCSHGIVYDIEVDVEESDTGIDVENIIINESMDENNFVSQICNYINNNIERGLLLPGDISESLVRCYGISPRYAETLESLITSRLTVSNKTINL